MLAFADQTGLLPDVCSAQGRLHPCSIAADRGVLAAPGRGNDAVANLQIHRFGHDRIAMVEPPLPGGLANQDQTKDQRTQTHARRHSEMA